jgi:hypothetical protein
LGNAAWQLSDLFTEFKEDQDRREGFPDEFSRYRDVAPEPTDMSVRDGWVAGRDLAETRGAVIGREARIPLPAAACEGVDARLMVVHGRFARVVRTVVLVLVLGGFPLALPAQERIITVVGSVTEEVSAQAVERVSVLHRGELVTTSDRDGRFRIDTLVVTEATLSLAFQRVGFQRRFVTVDVPPDRQVVELNVTLIRFPTILEEVTVDGRQITIRNPGLIGFYERREEDFGRYLTQEEIDRSLGFNLDNFYRRLRFPATCTPLIPLVVYLDGVRVPPLPGQASPLERVNDIIMPGQLGGIELYADERAARLPQEFIPAGPYCGVAMFWTRTPKGPSAGRIYTHVSSGFGQPTASRIGIGGGFAFPLRSGSPLEFQGGFQSVLGGAADLWRAFVDVTTRPFGDDSSWFVGAGITIAKPRSGVNTANAQRITAKPTLLSGFRLRTGRLQPFVELRIVDIANPGDSFLVSLFGVGFQFGGG